MSILSSLWLRIGPWVLALSASEPLALAQEGTPARVIEIDGRAYLAQPSRRGELRLTPNTCFFEGSGLRARGEGPEELPSAELNKNRSFASLTGFTERNRAVWFVHVPRAGDARLSIEADPGLFAWSLGCLLYTSPSPRDQRGSRMPSSA